MKIVVFGLTISSSWGNGHATLWRGLSRALHGLGHSMVFFERDVHYYARHRDASSITGCDLRLYADWPSALAEAEREVSRSDLAIVTSYCADARAATEIVLAAPRTLRVFYDLDTPVTLDSLESGQTVPYLPEGGLSAFDLVLSFTGGRALDALRSRLGARRVAALYGSVDPHAHRPVPADTRFSADLAYLGTYGEDRRAALDAFLLEPARRLPDMRFLVAGALYPATFPWAKNIAHTGHVPPDEHAAFFSSCGLSLNLTRQAMSRWGWCPSGRLFEAAASGAPQISDVWDGLDSFFEPESEILLARTPDDVVDALRRPRAELRAVADAGRARVFRDHTAFQRANELLALVEGRRPGAARSRHAVAAEEA